jgi:glycosyltransferase involved in cell wall biosynthesis
VHDNTVVGPLYASCVESLPIVSTNHGPFDDEFRALYRASGDRVAIVAISQHQASTASEIDVDAVIHHGVDPEDFPRGDGGGGYFLFLGRMTPEKGAREAALVARETGIGLLMAAKLRERREHEYFETYVRPVLGNGVEYLGEVDHEQKLALLAGAHGLLNPIQWPEPFGLVMIEALACGTPVFAFPSGAAPEIVRDGETGFLCTDVETMAARITDVENIDRRTCRAAVENYFSTERMCRDYATLFERIVSNSVRGPRGREAHGVT